MERDMTLLKSPDQFKTDSGETRAKDWTDYLHDAILRETGEKPNFISADFALWSRVLKGRVNSGVDPFVFALMIDIIALDWKDDNELSPWQLTTHEYIYKFFTGRHKWFWRAVWFSRYAKGEKEISLYIEYLMKTETGHSMNSDEVINYCENILGGFEQKVIERRKDDKPSLSYIG